MMELKKFDVKQWAKIKEIYVEAFPKRERKPFFTLKHSVKKGKARIMVAVVGAVFVGVSVGSCVRVGGDFKLYSTEQNLVFVADCYFIRTNHRANAEGKTSGILSGACGRIL